MGTPTSATRAARHAVHDFDSLAASLAAHERPAPPELPLAEALLRFAPLALAEGCWLWPHARVRRSEGRFASAVLDTLHACLGSGEPGLAAAEQYRALAASAGLSRLPLNPRDCAGDARLRPEDLALAAPAWALADDDGAAHEAAGYQAAWAICGVPAAVLGADAALTSSRYGGARAAGHPEALHLARRLVEACVDERGAEWARVWDGAARYLESVTRWHSSLAPARAQSARARMVQLVAAKARHAHGHHGGVILDGRALDDHLGPSAVSPTALVDALARSHHVKPGAPDESPLLTRASQFGGPMFGVFTRDEVATLRTWIEELGQPAAPEPAPRDATRPPPAAGVPEPAPAAARAAVPSSARDRYARLLRAASHDPAADRLADDIVRAALGSSSREQLARDGLWPYREGALRAWVDERLWEQVHPRGPALDLERGLDREQARWLLLQLTPAALVDGAWLERIVELSPGAPALACALFDIYRDELGGGVPERHHGNVMRRTLQREGRTLPACDAPSFLHLEQLTDEAFCLPVLWLAIARRQRDYLPELLGLNLAIEMAGIGDSYGRAIATLRRLGMDPLFFELHQSIDNGASGHTRWSVDSVASYLSTLAAAGDASLVGAAWLRFWRGHGAYAAASGPLTRRIGLELGPRLAWRWLASNLGTLASRGGA